MVWCVSYPIPRYRMEETPRQRGAKRRETETWKAKINRFNSYTKLEQLLYCNFRPGDYYITLTYKDEPPDRRTVMKDFRYFIKLLRTARSERGGVCQYIYAVEHKHGEGRWHMHLVLNYDSDRDPEEISRCWKHGYVFLTRYRETEASELARYLTKEQPEHVGEHTWIPARGMRRPLVETHLVKDSDRLCLPPGVVVKDREQKDNYFGSFEFIKYFRP